MSDDMEPRPDLYTTTGARVTWGANGLPTLHCRVCDKPFHKGDRCAVGDPYRHHDCPESNFHECPKCGSTEGHIDEPGKTPRCYRTGCNSEDGVLMVRRQSPLSETPKFSFDVKQAITTFEEQQDDDTWPPPPSGRVYKTDGTPEELLKELRNALAAVYGHLEEAQGDHDCCYAGITESYCGIFGCTPDGCYGHERDCPCDEGTAVRFLLEMADGR